jgi:hypothetical protein
MHESRLKLTRVPNTWELGSSIDMLIINPKDNYIYHIHGLLAIN